MNDTINGKTPDEIKKGLKCCSYSHPGCVDCAYYGLKFPNCIVLRSRDALAYIRQLERERDAPLADLREADHVDCSHCKSYIHAESNDCEYADFLCDNCEVKECSCRNCKDGSNWQWRGAPEVE